MTILFPLDTTELAGGRSLRVTVSLADAAGQPVEGAAVQVELRSPDGNVFAAVPGADQGQGRYLADYVRLPQRGAEGTWRVVTRATWGDDQQAQAERAFIKGLPFLSEELQRQYGFWIEAPSVPGCDYNSLTHKTGQHEDGSGYVLMYNGCHGRVNLDVHWQHAAFPADEASAIACARSLLDVAQHEEDYGVGLEPNLLAERITFQGRLVWRVVGRSKTTHGKVRGGPIEWLIFQCPGSELLWTIIISTSNEPAYMDHLRALRETFQCPTAASQ
ncbi:MAG: FixH family protein [Chloroflexi bacterium]|nr:FixH family protein [Chloroflexota bacterium]MBU1748301.1 FixH family protein [Chloroflexota bacterium]MBU1879387.1 FixH family protein [Chloroflexota bacterium]